MAATGVVHDDIARTQDLLVVLVGESHLTGDDEVELLALVAGQVHGHVLLLFQIGSGDHEGLGQLVAEMRRLVQVLEASAALDGKARALARERVARQVRVLAGEQLDDVDAELLGALVQEGEGEILLAGLLCGVLRRRPARGLGHLLQREIHVLPQSANTPRHLFDIRLHDLRPPYRFSKMTVARYFTGISAVNISNRLKSRRCAYSFSRSLAIARREDEMEKSFCRRQFLLDAKRAAQDLEIVLFWPAEGLQEKRRYRKAYFPRARDQIITFSKHETRQYKRL